MQKLHAVLFKALDSVLARQLKGAGFVLLLLVSTGSGCLCEKNSLYQEQQTLPSTTKNLKPKARWQGYLSAMRGKAGVPKNSAEVNLAENQLRLELSQLKEHQVPLVVALVEVETEPKNRQILFLELGLSKHDSAIDFLQRYLLQKLAPLEPTSQRDWEGQVVIEAMGRAGTAYSFNKLAGLLTTGPPQWTASVLRSLAVMPQVRQLDAQYIGLLSSEQATIRARAALALGHPDVEGQLPDFSWVPTIEKALVDEMEEAPLLAISECLGRLARPSSLEALEDAVIRARGAKAKLVIVDAIANIGTQQAGQALARIIKVLKQPRVIHRARGHALRLLADD